MTLSPSNVSLFIPCLVEHFYPDIGMSMVKILEALSFHVDYKVAQTCCGQPAFNAGHNAEALEVATNFVELFRDAECVVAPSGSCIAMVRNFFPKLFVDNRYYDDAIGLQGKTFEFSELIVRTGKIDCISGTAQGRIGFHNSCHSYRELSLVDEPLQLMNQITGYELIIPDGDPVCCGFGGLFSVKYPSISSSMAEIRLEKFEEKSINTLVSNDPGCIMHLKNELKIAPRNLEILHITEFLARAMKL